MAQEIKCYDLPKGFDEDMYPNAAKYIRLHGILNSMSEFDVKAPYKTREEVYAECLKRGVTWQVLLNHQTYDPNIIY